MSGTTIQAAGQKLALRNASPHPGPGTVLVTFDFTNPKFVPEGITFVERADDYTIDSKNAAEAIARGDIKASAVGSQRQGRVTTGLSVVKNLPMTRISAIRVGLVNNGYRLVDIHYTKHTPMRPKQPGKPVIPKWKVVLTYRQPELITKNNAGNMVGPNGEILSNHKVDEALRQLATTTFAYAHIWDNRPNGKDNAAINLVGRQPNAKAQHEMIVEDNHLLMVKV